MTLPRAAPELVYRYLSRTVRRSIEPAAARAAGSRVDALRILYLADIRLSARAGQRHPDDGDVPRAGRARPRGDAGRAARHAARRRAIRSPSTGCRRSTAADRARAGDRAGRRAAAWLPRRSPSGAPRGAPRPDVVFTRDLGVASLLLRLPRALRPPLVYESHGYAPDVAAALPELVATATAPASAASCAGSRGARRSVWRTGRRLCHDHRGARRRRSSAGRGSERADGVDSAVAPTARRHRWSPRQGPQDSRRDRARAATAPSSRYAGHLYPWKGVDVLLEALALRARRRAAASSAGIRAEPDLARLRRCAERLGIARAGRRSPGLVEPGDGRRRCCAAPTSSALPNPASAISTASRRR